MLLAFLLYLAHGFVPASFSLQDSPSRPTDITGRIWLTASDQAGNLVPTPSKESLQLRIGGQPVEIEEVRALKDSPLFFSVLVDISGSSRRFAERQILATTKLFHDLSIGDNRGYLILFKYELDTNDQFISAATVEGVMKRFPAQTRLGATAVYDALVHAATNQLSSKKIPKDARRAIFLLSDGGDKSSRQGLDETIKVLQKEGIPVFSIGLSRSTGFESPREMKRDLQVLNAINKATGGWGAFLDDPGDSVQRAADLANGQSLVSFRPPGLKARKSYEVSVESSSKDIRIMVSKQYVVP